MKVKWTGKTEFLMLTNGKVYEVLSIEKEWFRVIDDSGDDYLYPPEKFEIIEEINTNEDVKHSSNSFELPESLYWGDPNRRRGCDMPEITFDDLKKDQKTNKSK